VYTLSLEGFDDPLRGRLFEEPIEEYPVEFPGRYQDLLDLPLPLSVELAPDDREDVLDVPPS